MTSRPAAKAMAVYATGAPMVHICSTAAPRMKFTPAPANRPIDVQKANSAGQRVLAPEAVGHRPPDEGDAPPGKEDREQDRAIEPDRLWLRRDAGTGQQLGQGRRQHQGINEAIHAIQHPAEPGASEARDLLPVKRGARRPVAAAPAPSMIDFMSVPHQRFYVCYSGRLAVSLGTRPDAAGYDTPS